MKASDKPWGALGMAVAMSLLMAGCTSLANQAQSATTGSTVAFKDADFQPSSNCAVCHPQIYQQWKGSVMALSIGGTHRDGDPLFTPQNTLANAETGGATNQFCFRCHTPIGFLAGHAVASDGSQLTELDREGITCDFCHRVTGAAGVSNMQAIMDPNDNAVHGGLSDPTASTHGEIYSQFIQTGEFCAICHEVNTPAMFPAERTYREWKNSPYAESGVTCQDCHMSAGITHFQASPGQLATSGPVRANVPLHYFAAATTDFPGMTGRSTDSIAFAVKTLQSACSLGIDNPDSVFEGTNLNFDIAVTNVGAGHNVPSGVSEDRQMWLEVQVLDGTGQELYHSGAVGPDGKLDPMAVDFHRILGNEYGKPVDRIWQARTVLSDTTIPAKATRYGNYSVPIPVGTQGPVTIKATLHFRAASQQTMDLAFGRGVRTAPIVDMASTSAVLRVFQPATGRL